MNGMESIDRSIDGLHVSASVVGLRMLECRRGWSSLKRLAERWSGRRRSVSVCFDGGSTRPNPTPPIHPIHHRCPRQLAAGLLAACVCPSDGSTPDPLSPFPTHPLHTGRRHPSGERAAAPHKAAAAAATAAARSTSERRAAGRREGSHERSACSRAGRAPHANATRAAARDARCASFQQLSLSLAACLLLFHAPTGGT